MDYSNMNLAGLCDYLLDFDFSSYFASNDVDDMHVVFSQICAYICFGSICSQEKGTWQKITCLVQFYYYTPSESCTYSTQESEVCSLR